MVHVCQSLCPVTEFHIMLLCIRRRVLKDVCSHLNLLGMFVLCSLISQTSVNMQDIFLEKYYKMRM